MIHPSTEAAAESPEVPAQAVEEELLEGLLFPCTLCSQEVKDDHEALMCDICEGWCHTQCAGFEDTYDDKYEELEDFNFDWTCPPCVTVAGGQPVGPSD